MQFSYNTNKYLPLHNTCMQQDINIKDGPKLSRWQGGQLAYPNAN